jgi:hypothetical protein
MGPSIRKLSRTHSQPLLSGMVFLDRLDVVRYGQLSASTSPSDADFQCQKNIVSGIAGPMLAEVVVNPLVTISDCSIASYVLEIPAEPDGRPHAIPEFPNHPGI